MHARSTWLEELDQAIAAEDWNRCRETTFRILYALPEQLPLDLAAMMVRQAWNEIGTTRQGVSWPREMFEAPAEWVKKFGRRVPDDAEPGDPAGAAFLFAIDALLLAHAYRTDGLILTSASVVAVNAAIDSQRIAVWMREDPEAVEMWKTQAAAQPRHMGAHKTATVVAAREWWRVYDSLNAHDVGNYPVDADTQEMQRALEQWRSREHLLIMPARNR